MGWKKMKISRFLHLMFGPDPADEIASVPTGFAPIIMNAGSGIVLMSALAVSLKSVCTTALAVLLVLLFGPFVGFLVSSLYSRLEWFVGNRLGGKSSLDALYGVFPWLFLPVSFALLVFVLILLFMDIGNQPPETVMLIAAAIPSLVIVCFALRNYWLTIVAIRQFTQKKGAVSVVLTFVLFVALISLAVFILLLFARYSMVLSKT